MSPLKIDPVYKPVEEGDNPLTMADNESAPTEKAVQLSESTDLESSISDQMPGPVPRDWDEAIAVMRNDIDVLAVNIKRLEDEDQELLSLFRVSCIPFLDSTSWSKRP